MKLKKKTAILLSFVIGTLLVAGTALADIASKSGYDQLKDALKLTTAGCSNKFNSYTLDISMAVKDNGKIVSANDTTQKYDMVKHATDSVNSSEYAGQQVTYYFYSDATSQISHSSKDDTYVVMNYSRAQKQVLFTDPFQNNSAEDIEKIVDAVVGNLKDYVVVKDNADGSKELSGTLTEVQIPPLVNAVASFEMKQQFANPNQGALVVKDIYIKEIKGTAQINKDGVMQSLLGTVILSGKDAKGEVHELTLEVLGKLSNINSTAVTKPNLTGKKVSAQTVQAPNSIPGLVAPQEFVGSFKNNIIISQDGKFVKIGERILEITQIDSKTVKGRYHEEYKAGFEQYASHKQDFQFEGTFNSGPNQDPQGANFVVPGTNIQGMLHFDEMTGNVNLDGSFQMSKNFNPTFNMVLN